MAQTVRNYKNISTQWQMMGGYYPEPDPVREDKLEKRIARSRRISTLLLNWFWNTIVAGGIMLTSVLFIVVAVLIIAHTGNCIR